ncbi:MAG: hypothetical protein HS122_01035 [Opitutaceae bacterium]|nr:hypothetical protein [Opitutaceae bacterium]
MKTLPQNELTLVSGGGGEPVYVDIGQFVGGYAKSIVQHWYLGPLAGTYAFFDSLAYAFED